MSSTSRTRRAATAAAWVAAGAVTATAVTGLAFASTGSPASPASTGSTTLNARPAWSATAGLAGGGAARRGLLRTVLHGELTVRTASGTATVELQRGTLTAASATSVSVASSDGFAATYQVGATTVVRRDGRTVAADALVAGDPVVVRASAGMAQTVRALSPAALTRLRDRLAQRRAAGTGTGSNGSTPPPSITPGA